MTVSAGSVARGLFRRIVANYTVFGKADQVCTSLFVEENIIIAVRTPENVFQKPFRGCYVGGSVRPCFEKMESQGRFLCENFIPFTVSFSESLKIGSGCSTRKSIPSTLFAFWLFGMWSRQCRSFSWRFKVDE